MQFLYLSFPWARSWAVLYILADNILALDSKLRTRLPGGSDCKESTCSARDLGLIPGSGRFPGEGNVYPLQYSCLENSMKKGAWWVTVHGMTESDMTEPLKLSFTLFRPKKQRTWKILPGGSGSGRKTDCHGLHMPGMSNVQSHCFQLCKGQVSVVSQSNSGFLRTNMKPEIDLLSAQSPHCFPKFLGNSVTLLFSH